MQHSQRIAQRLHQSSRAFHASSKAQDLVGPVHPLTNLRPILYNDIPPTASSSSLTSAVNKSQHHPYSLSEFSHDEPSRHSDIELQWRLHRVQTELFHHEFWLDSNTRFNAGTQTILSCLPPNARVEDKEAALSEFYKQWVTQEKDRMQAYTTEWRRRNWAGVILGARVEWRRFLDRLGGMVPGSSRS